MRIEILDDAQEDLIEGFRFYEKREIGVGSYFLDCLFSDIDSLVLFAGIHQLVYGITATCQAFSFRHLLNVVGDLVRVHAVLDCRRNPLWIRKLLKPSG